MNEGPRRHKRQVADDIRGAAATRVGLELDELNRRVQLGHRLVLRAVVGHAVLPARLELGRVVADDRERVQHVAVLAAVERGAHAAQLKRAVAVAQELGEGVPERVACAAVLVCVARRREERVREEVVAVNEGLVDEDAVADFGGVIVG